VSVALLRRFGFGLGMDYAPSSRQALLQQFVASDIAAAGNPVALFAWPTDSAPVAAFATAQIPIPKEVAQIVARARQTEDIVLEAVPTDTSLQLVMAAPSPAGGVTAVVMGPRSRLFEPDPFARLVGLEADPEGEPPYTVRLRDRAPVAAAGGPIAWRRDRDRSELHGDWIVRTGNGASQAHIEVELRPLNALVQRGSLIVLLNLTLVGFLWLVSVVADGGGGRWLRARRRTWGRSYRLRLSLALLAFFVIPATAFAIWSYEQLATDATQSRSVLVRETLRALAPPQRPLWLPAEADRLDSPLFLYYGGVLSETSDSLLTDIAPIGRFLDRDAELSLSVRGEATDTRLEDLDHSSMLFGYRSFNEEGRPSIVIGAPARADELALGRRRRDLGVLVVFATAVGALAALWLSGIAARQLARPIGTLRAAALSLAGGERTPPLEGEPTVEFSPVFTAFRRMTEDLNASRTALEEAQRRTATVLRNVASGVVAVDPDGRVSLSNPSAETLFGNMLIAGAPFASQAPADVAVVVARFLESKDDEEVFEIAVDQRQLRGTLTRLARGGAVVTLDDVTELARAQRVLAWGEMARQVAHEIKNPLTPIRLGVQHLRRARADKRVDFDRVLDHNVNQILMEIDRLDEIARAFSRYGAAPDERGRPSSIDVAAIVREVISLERMGAEGGVQWEEHGVDVPLRALALGDELKEVLLNVLENARLAQAKTVRVVVSLGDDVSGERNVLITVRDDGHGIPPEVLPRIFEPHFSTRTSGSGLGLAISRQLVEGWGGAITVSSEIGKGTTVEIRLRGDRTFETAQSNSDAGQ
jgi:signal transduction histidine kinase